MDERLIFATKLADRHRRVGRRNRISDVRRWRGKKVCCLGEQMREGLKRSPRHPHRTVPFSDISWSNPPSRAVSGGFDLGRLTARKSGNSADKDLPNSG